MHRDLETCQERGWEQRTEVGCKLLGVNRILVSFGQSRMFLVAIGGFGGGDEFVKEGQEMSSFVFGEISQTGVDSWILLAGL